MKTSTLILLSVPVVSISFMCSYFFELSMNNFEQYLAVIGVMLLDGFFGIIKGIRLEGFQTRKAIKVLKTLFTWIVILTVLLMVERGFPGTSWLSETIILPFIVFQLMSALKNASLAGFIQNELLNTILDKIDKHKGLRNEKHNNQN
jgi:phage-related holin